MDPEPLRLKAYPTPFQRKTLWTAVTALSLVVTVALVVGLIFTVSKVLGFLQPFLVPFAMAGVLAYLLEPAVVWLEKGGLSRQRAVLAVFAAFSLAFGGLGWWLVHKVSVQSKGFDTKLATYTLKVRQSVLQFAEEVQAKYGVDLLPPLPTKTETTEGSKEPATGTNDAEPSKGLAVAETETVAPILIPFQETDELPNLRDFLSGDWVLKTVPTVLTQAWRLIRSSLGGFLGVFGFFLSLIIVPLYLYYFLIESAHIKKTWSDYLPLRASAFKDELVDCLTEINGYLIAFFRGQLFVSVINGIATGIGLMIVGLDFGILIGLMLCVLGIIPYLGIAICWLPAVAIAAVQGGSALVPGDPWWMLPLVVTIIFAVVQQIDGFFISPKIVGESVGLHPMTVIVSVFVWSLLLGGLLGAILAVPLTASVKVLFQRYIWLARLSPHTVGGSRAELTSVEP